MGSKFDADSRVTARRIAQPPRVAFVTRLRPPVTQPNRSSATGLIDNYPGGTSLHLQHAPSGRTQTSPVRLSSASLRRAPLLRLARKRPAERRRDSVAVLLFWPCRDCPRGNCSGIGAVIFGRGWAGRSSFRRSLPASFLAAPSLSSSSSRVRSCRCSSRNRLISFLNRGARGGASCGPARNGTFGALRVVGDPYADERSAGAHELRAADNRLAFLQAKRTKRGGRSPCPTFMDAPD